MSEPVLTITSQEDAVELILTHEQVLMKLSDAVAQEFQRDTQADPDTQAPGLVGRFTRMVTGAVGKMISSTIEYPLDDIESVTDRDGTLVFAYRKRRTISFESISVIRDGANVPALAAFSPADVQRFVQQFASVKAQTAR
jgi:hypothetical protein